MTSNVGGLDRGIRLISGVVLILLPATHVLAGLAGIVAYVVGAIALLTGLVRYCPAWSISGTNTCALNSGAKK